MLFRSQSLHIRWNAITKRTFHRGSKYVARDFASKYPEKSHHKRLCWASKWWPNELRNFENPNNWPSPTPVEVDLLLQQRGLKVNTTFRPGFSKRMEEGVKSTAATSLSPKEIIGKKQKLLTNSMVSFRIQNYNMSNCPTIPRLHLIFKTPKKHTKTHTKSHMLRLQNWLKAFVGDVARPKYPRILARGTIHQCHPSQGTLGTRHFVGEPRYIDHGNDPPCYWWPSCRDAAWSFIFSILAWHQSAKGTKARYCRETHLYKQRVCFTEGLKDLEMPWRLHTIHALSKNIMNIYTSYTSLSQWSQFKSHGKKKCQIHPTWQIFKGSSPNGKRGGRGF